ncbi:MAG: hypothetical protein KIY10_10835 [Thermoplasmata archaeon]|nr:hypothetical protein [Candidatus Sysuiplasma jiujiangense]MBX8643055.1 hypothetical protein [Candidatus Sysuiplasma jiujiangense]
MSYYGVSPPSLISWLNPLDAINNVIQIILYFFAMSLYYLAELFNLMLSVIFGVISGVMASFVSVAASMGPFALPIFVILLALFISIVLIMGMIVHDLPVVGGVA